MPLAFKTLFNPKSIRFHLTAMMGMVLLALAAFIYFYFSWNMRNLVLEPVTKGFQDQIASLEPVLSKAVRENDRAQMEAQATRIQEWDNVLYVVVVDKSDNVLAARNLEAAEAMGYDQMMWDPSGSDSLNTDLGRSVFMAGINYWHQDELIGGLYLGLSLKDLRPELAKTNRLPLAAAVFVFLVGMLCAVLFISTLTDPFVRLLRTMEHQQPAQEIGNLETHLAGTYYNKLLDQLKQVEHARNQSAKELEAALSQQKQQFEAALLQHNQGSVRDERVLEEMQHMMNAAPVYLLSLDPQGIVLYINDALAALLGREAQELQGLFWFEECIPRAERAPLKQRLHDLVAGREPLREYSRGMVLDAAGRSHRVVWRNRVLRDADGRLKGIMSAGADISLVTGLERFFREEHSLETTA